jgi:hypothetical protein
VRQKWEFISYYLIIRARLLLARSFTLAFFGGRVLIFLKVQVYSGLTERAVKVAIAACCLL